MEADSFPYDAVIQEEAMAEKTSTNGDSTQATSKSGGKLELAKKEENGQKGAGLSLAKSESAKGEMEVSTFSAAGLRPIAPSHLEIYGTILNNRPILSSHLQVLEYLPGNRPVFASELVILDDMSLGGRPIVASDPHLMEGSTLPGGRPIASNEIDDSETLMGFID
jgi:hypothetical protein